MKILVKIVAWTLVAKWWLNQRRLDIYWIVKERRFKKLVSHFEPYVSKAEKEIDEALRLEEQKNNSRSPFVVYDGTPAGLEAAQLSAGLSGLQTNGLQCAASNLFAVNSAREAARRREHLFAREARRQQLEIEHQRQIAAINGERYKHNYSYNADKNRLVLEYTFIEFDSFACRSFGDVNLAVASLESRGMKVFRDDQEMKYQIVGEGITPKQYRLFVKGY